MFKIVVIAYTLILALALALISPVGAQTKPSITEEMAKIMVEKDIGTATTFCRQQYYCGDSQYSFPLDNLMQMSIETFQADKREDALLLGELTAELYPNEYEVHSGLAQLYFFTNNRGRALSACKRALELKPNSITDIIFQKKLTLVPNDFIVPTHRQTENFLIRPLLGSDAELDYKAVMSSREHLLGVFGRGDWPSESLSLEEDRQALQGHEWEFPRRVAFTYTVLNLEETECLGCIYIYPGRLDIYDAEIIMWVSTSAYEKGLDPVLVQNVKEWINLDWPFKNVAYLGRDVEFREYMMKLGEQDEAGK